MTLGRTLGLQNPGCRAGCIAYRIMNLHENQPKRVLLASFTPGETEKQFSKYHCYLGVETRPDPRGLSSRAQEEVSPPAEEGKVRGHFGQAARGRGAQLALFLGSTGRWAPPSDPEPPGPGCSGEGETLGRVLSPGRRRWTGCPRAGLAAGTGWRVPRRLNLQEDILIRSRLRQRSAAAGGRTGLLSAPLPRAPAGRETELAVKETGAAAPGRPRGAGALEGLAASCQGQSSRPRLGRLALNAPGGEGRRAGGGGQGGAGARPRWTLPAPSRGRYSGFPTQGRMELWCAGQRLGPRLRGLTPSGGNGV